MAVLSREDLLNSIKDKFKDDTSDDTLALIANLSDTINDLTEKSSGEEGWKKKYEENDKQWREKYKERFFSGDTSTKQEQKTETDTDNDTEERVPGYHDDGTPMTFDELFKKGSN